MTTEISNKNDTIDTRDLIDRIEELEAICADEGDEISPASEEEKEELKILLAFQEEIEGYCSDYKHGEILIRDDYFQEYAQQLAEDIGAIDKNSKWPNSCIDWEKAAEELQQDYTSAEFDGVTYWFR